jgi:hypothetical protein
MEKNRTRLLKAVRRQMIEILRTGCGYRQTELQKKFHTFEYWNRNHSTAAIYVLIGECVRIYDADFYRDPSTHRIFLSRRALVMERIQEDVGASLVGAQERAGTRPAPTKWLGNTASGRTGEALDAREA